MKWPTLYPLRSGEISAQPDRYCFEGNLWESTERRGAAHMCLSERCDAIFSGNRKLENRCANAMLAPTDTHPHVTGTHCDKQNTRSTQEREREREREA